MAIAPKALVAPPPRQPLPYGLFSVFTFRTGDRWEGGVAWESPTCEPLAGIGEPDCPPATPQPDWPPLPPYVPEFPQPPAVDPVISALMPSFGNAGVQSNVQVYGSGFANDSVVQADGVVTPSTFVSANQLTVPYTPVAGAGSVSFTVHNADGKVSNAWPWTVTGLDDPDPEEPPPDPPAPPAPEQNDGGEGA